MPSRLAHHRSHRLFGIGIVLLLSRLVVGCGLLTSEKAIDPPDDRFSEAPAQPGAGR